MEASSFQTEETEWDVQWMKMETSAQNTAVWLRWMHPSEQRQSAGLSWTEQKAKEDEIPQIEEEGLLSARQMTRVCG